MRCLEIKREMSHDDIANVNELLDAAARADGRRPLSDHLYLDLVNGGVDGFAGFVAREPGHDHPVAYAQISRGNDVYAFELVLHPHHRYEMATIGPELIDAALDVIGSEGGGTRHWWVFEPTSAHRALAADAGMREGRRLHQMRRTLPTGLPVRSTTRAFVPGRRRRRLAGGQQPGVRGPLRAGRLDDGDASASVSRRTGSIRRASASTSATVGWPASAGPRSTHAEGPDRTPGRDLRDRRRSRLPRAGSRQAADACRARTSRRRRASRRECSTSTPTTRPPCRMYERLGFHVHSTNAAFVADDPRLERTS